MQAIYFTLTGIILFVFADWALQRIEMTLGRRLEHRSLIFFGLLLGAALVAFPLIRAFGDL